MMPCAECGGEYPYHVEILGDGHRYWCRCTICGYVSRMEGSKAWAVRSWNREQKYRGDSSPRKRFQSRLVIILTPMISRVAMARMMIAPYIE